MSQSTAAGTLALPGSSVSAGVLTRPLSATIPSTDVAGAVIVTIPLLLGAFFATGFRPLEYAMYAVLVLAFLPNLAPYFGSFWKSPANLLLTLLFGVLMNSTLSLLLTGDPDQWLGIKALAATAAWASVQAVTFLSFRTFDGAARLMRWLHIACLLVTLSVYLAAAGHLAGFQFGEVLTFRDGQFRAFGPLGDQVAFVLVLPALISLASGRPLEFGFHLGALLLTGTRSGVICLAVGVFGHLLFVLFSPTRRSQLVRRPWRVVLATVTVGVAILFSPISSTLFARWLEPTLRPASIQLGLEILEKSPMTGVGFNGFERLRPAVAEDWLAPDIAANGLSRTNNQLVQTATDGGIPALVLLLFFVWLTFVNAFRVMRSPSASAALVASQMWLIALLIGNQTSLWLLSDTATGFFVFAVAGIGARVSLLAQRRQ